MLRIRRLIFIMGIPIPGKDGLYIETGPRSCTNKYEWPIFTLSSRVVATNDSVYDNRHTDDY